MLSIGDLKDFDSVLRFQCRAVRGRLRDMLAGHRLMLAEFPWSASAMGYEPDGCARLAEATGAGTSVPLCLQHV